MTVPPTIRRHRVAPEGTREHAMFEKFVCPPGAPGRTLDAVAPDVRISLDLIASMDLPLPFALADGSRKLKMWVIRKDGGTPVFPSPAIRVRAGQVVHARVGAKGGAHTVHWHGIEPSPMNDGVGKHSFEIRGNYTYQWAAAEPGLYFYHCHRNTPLHFEMGLYGGLIVDPPQGPGFVTMAGAPSGVIRYDREVVWALTAHDSRWHGLGTAEGLLACGDDPNDPASFAKAGGILDDWRPDVFTISGAVANGDRPVTDPRAAATARVGDTVLVRALNASYAVQEWRFGADVEVIAQDGRAYGLPPYGVYSEPFTVPAGTPIRTTSAVRHDILLRPKAPGVIEFTCDHVDWRGSRVFGRVRTAITVR